MTHLASRETSDTSVLFNLRELMQIEHERVQTEAAHERALREAERAEQEERARRIAEQATKHAEDQQAAALAEQRARDAEERRLQTVRDAALLQVRLQVEADARRAEERIARSREIELKRIEGTTHRQRATWLLGSALVSTLIIFATVYLGLVAPRLANTQQETLAAQARAEQATREIIALRNEMRVTQTKASSKTETIAAPSPHDAIADTTKAKPNAPAKPKTKVRTNTRTTPANTGLDRLDGDDADPLFGLDTPR